MFKREESDLCTNQKLELSKPTKLLNLKIKDITVRNSKALFQFQLPIKIKLIKDQNLNFK